MKVIDLLNKIANGEETPKKFKFATQIFIKEGLRYIDEDGDDIFESIFNDFSNINDEIEIIEEDKLIEKIFGLHHPSTKNLDLIREDIELAFETIDKLIDKLNELEKENE